LTSMKMNNDPKFFRAFYDLRSPNGVSVMERDALMLAVLEFRRGAPVDEASPILDELLVARTLEGTGIAGLLGRALL
jgi:hypothetical protein